MHASYPRHPTVVAQQALTVQDVTDNRLALGIGLSHKFMIEDSLGLDYSRPIPHTRDYLTILNGLLAGDTVNHDGDEYQVNAQVTVAGVRKPPVLVAALGPAMLRLSGRLADGTITWMGGIDYLRDTAIPTMTEAARKAGRPAPDSSQWCPYCSPTTKTPGATSSTKRSRCMAESRPTEPRSIAAALPFRPMSLSSATQPLLKLG